MPAKRHAAEARATQAARTLARLARVIERASQEHGLSLAQYRLLLLVSRAPQRAGELASRAALSRPALTDLVDGLVRQGLICREPVDTDRRGVRLALTAEGSRALAAAEAAIVARVEEIVRGAGASAVFEPLAKVGTHLDELWRVRAPQEPS